MSTENGQSSRAELFKPGAERYGASANFTRPAAAEHAATASVVFTEPKAFVETYGPSANFKRPPVTSKI